MRLSSDYLFHYKQSFSVFQSILKDGFRHNLWDESLPYKESSQYNYICSFCDIRPKDAEYHRECYGSYAIALTKEWGIKNGISPVRYVHEGSRGVSQKYIELKNLFRRAKGTGNDDYLTVMCDYLIASMVYEKDLLQNGDVKLSLSRKPELVKEMLKAESSIDQLLNAMKQTGKGDELIQILVVLFSRINALQDELENRDSYMRAYSEDFTPSHGVTIENKILYDEHEWRSVKYVIPNERDNGRQEYLKALKNRYLSPKYNLKFDDEDVRYLVVDRDEDIKVLLDLVENDPRYQLSSKAVESKIMTFETLRTQDLEHNRESN